MKKYIYFILASALFTKIVFAQSILCHGDYESIANIEFNDQIGLVLSESLSPYRHDLGTSSGKWLLERHGEDEKGCSDPGKRLNYLDQRMQWDLDKPQVNKAPIWSQSHKISYWFKYNTGVNYNGVSNELSVFGAFDNQKSELDKLCNLQKKGGSVVGLRGSDKDEWLVYLTLDKNESKEYGTNYRSNYLRYSKHNYALNIQRVCAECLVEPVKNGESNDTFCAAPVRISLAGQYFPDNEPRIDLTTAANGKILLLAYDTGVKTLDTVNSGITLNKITSGDKDDLIIDASINVTQRDASCDGNDGYPKFSPDGKLLAFVRKDNKYAEQTRNWIQIVGSEDLLRYDRNSLSCNSDTEDKYRVYFDNPIVQYEWSCDGKCLVVLEQFEGHSKLHQFNVSESGLVIANSLITVMEKTSGYVSHMALGPKGLHVHLVVSSLSQPDHIQYYQRTSDDQHFRKMEINIDEEAFRGIVFNARYRKNLTKAMGGKFTYRFVDSVMSDDGRKLPFFVVFPVNHEVTVKPYPAVLLIHGGPTSAWNNSYYPQVVSLINQGNVVILPNPAGSTGYGWDYTDLSRNAWGTMVYDDLVTILNEVLNPDDKLALKIDSSKVSAIGASFGGYMVARMATRNPVLSNVPKFKFSSMVSINGIFDLESWSRSTDEQWYPKDQLNFTASNNNSNIAKHNPAVDAHRMKPNSAPVLLIAGGADQRVPYTQSVQFHNALKDACISSRLIVLDEESHNMIYDKDVLVPYIASQYWLGYHNEEIPDKENPIGEGVLNAMMYPYERKALPEHCQK